MPACVLFYTSPQVNLVFFPLFEIATGIMYKVLFSPSLFCSLGASSKASEGKGGFYPADVGNGSSRAPYYHCSGTVRALVCFSGDWGRPELQAALDRTRTRNGRSCTHVPRIHACSFSATKFRTRGEQEDWLLGEASRHAKGYSCYPDKTSQSLMGPL